MGGDVEEPPTLSAASVRRQWSINPAAPLVLYTGTFEAYQGLDMLLDAMAILARTRPAARLLVVGGRAGAGGSRAGARHRRRRAGNLHGAPTRAWNPGLRRGGEHPSSTSHCGNQHAAENLLRTCRGRGSPSSRPICSRTRRCSTARRRCSWRRAGGVRRRPRAAAGQTRSPAQPGTGRGARASATAARRMSRAHVWCAIA